MLIFLKTSFQFFGIFNLNLNFIFYKYFSIFLIVWIIIELILKVFNKNLKSYIFLNILFVNNLILLFFFPGSSFKFFLFNKTFLIDNFSYSFKVLIFSFFLFFSLYINTFIKNSFSIKKNKELYIYFLILLFFFIIFFRKLRFNFSVHNSRVFYFYRSYSIIYTKLFILV